MADRKRRIYRRRRIERVQTGLRIEKRVFKVLKAIAAQHEMTLGDLVEGIVLHAFEGKAPFGPETLKFIGAMRRAYGLDLTARDAHKLVEAEHAEAAAAQSRP